ncbi:hypothetical protein [Brenneria rubrifaciens]|uniref:hypothetical protein n=1 Tax=Brenneria rubrifaciens TaxID=55213 RepID=UPI00158677B5|nr:hypothetical protein [Brenneria rubrifaciens]
MILLAVFFVRSPPLFPAGRDVRGACQPSALPIRLPSGTPITIARVSPPRRAGHVSACGARAGHGRHDDAVGQFHSNG